MVIDYPLTVLRDYTIPMAEEERWEKVRACILPLTMVLSFFYLFNFLQPTEDDPGATVPYWYAGLLVMIPGLAFSIYIWFCTKKTVAPKNILTAYALLAFLQSVAWINWTSNCVVDLIVIFGFITELPQALLSLTVLAWGNSLGDMSADTAMTKKGFGEMGVTATMAGPIFNILMGQGLASLFTLIAPSKGNKFTITQKFIPYSTRVKDPDTGEMVFNKVSVLPITMLSAEFIILAILIVNALVNKFRISFKFSIIGAIFYFSFITFLIVYSITENLSAGG